MLSSPLADNVTTRDARMLLGDVQGVRAGCPAEGGTFASQDYLDPAGISKASVDLKIT